MGKNDPLPKVQPNALALTAAMSPASVTHTQLSPASPGVLVGLKPGSAQLTLLGSVELGQDAAFSQQHPGMQGVAI